jgi:RNA polymerase sigma factor (sigma-70 family)
VAATETSTRAAAQLDDLYRRHVGDVYRYTYAVLGNHADAEDVTQTTFVNALRALERGEVPRNASTWLVAIAQNVVRQRWRQASSRPAEVQLLQDVPVEPAEEDIELDELVRALQRIPPTQREALVLRELEGRSYNEISELLGLTTSALETLLFRARRSLAEELEALVTCQNAELAISKQLDGRLSRKDRRRLDEHLAECEDCSRLAATAKRQRRAFKGLAVLPLPIGLALFKGAPSASAASSLPTIGVGAGGANGAGAAGAGAGGAATATGAAAGGSAAVGGSLAVVAKVAAVIVAATVATGVAYKGVQAVLDGPTSTAKEKPATPSSGSSATSSPVRAKAAAPADPRASGLGSASGSASGAASAATEPPAASNAPVGRTQVAGALVSSEDAPASKPSGAGKSSGPAASAGDAGRSAGPVASPGSGGQTSGPAAGDGGQSAGVGGQSAGAPPAGGAIDAPGTPAKTAPKPTKPKKPKARNPKAAPKPKPAPTPPTASTTPPPSGPGSSNGSPPDQAGPPVGSGPLGSTPPADTPTPPVEPPVTPPSSDSSDTGETPSPDPGSTSSRPGCPAGGNGPGNGAGCGVANANGQDKGKDTP